MKNLWKSITRQCWIAVCRSGGRAVTTLTVCLTAVIVLLFIITCDSSCCWLRQPTYSDRHVTIGYTERDQLLLYLANSNLVDSLPANRQRHDVTLTSLTVTTMPALAVIKLRDDVTVLLATKRIRGGDSFRTIYRAANHRQACAYVDNADDTYDVICRLVDECADVSIHLTYVAFGAYKWDGAYINRLIWRGTVCANASTTATQRSNGDKNGVALAASAFAGWWRANTTQPLRWVKARGEQQVSDAEMTSCLASLPPPVYLVGDSHLRLVLNNIISITDSRARATNFSLGKLRTNYTRGMYKFSFGGFTVNHTAYSGFLADPQGLLPRFKELCNGTWKMTLDCTTVLDALAIWKLEEMQQSLLELRSISQLTLHHQSLRSANHRRRLVISFGTWDLNSINIKYFVSRSLPAFRQFLESLRRDGVMSRVKVIVTTTPAVWEQTYAFLNLGGLHSNLRNNAMLAAANRLLADTVLAFNDVALADWFAVTVSRSLQALDNTHYVNVKRKHELNDVGLAMMKLLVEDLCA